MKIKAPGLIIVAILALVGGWIFAKNVNRAMALRSARRIAMESLTPDDSRGGFDRVPQPLELLPTRSVGAIDSIQFGRHLACVPKPDSREDNEKWVDLHYPRFRVRFLQAMEMDSLDGIAKDLGLPDKFSVLSAAHHATREGIKSQPDIPSVKRNLALIALKSTIMAVGSETYYAEFQGETLRGFISGDISKGKRTVLVEAFSPTGGVDWGLHFKDTGGATMDDVKAFLSAIRIEETAQTEPSTGAATQK